MVVTDEEFDRSTIKFPLICVLARKAPMFPVEVKDEALPRKFTVPVPPLTRLIKGSCFSGPSAVFHVDDMVWI